MAALNYTPVGIVAPRVAIPVTGGRYKLARGTRRHQIRNLFTCQCALYRVQYRMYSAIKLVTGRRAGNHWINRF